MSNFKRRPLAAAILALFSATPQIAAAQAQREQTLPEVKVQGAPDSGFKNDSTSSGTRTETPLRDIPQFINTVPQEVLRSQGINSMADALRTVPGITMTAPEGGTQANDNFWIRGLPAGGDIFMDSVRNVGQYNHDLFNVESVEVLKGPSGLMFGRGSAGGVINEVSKTPLLYGLKEAGFVLGTFGQKRATADLNVKTGESSAFRLNALLEDSDSFRDGVNVRKVGIAPTLRLGIGTQTDITLSYYYLRDDGVTDYGQPNLGAVNGFRPAPISPRKYFGITALDYTNLSTQIATAKIDHRINDSVAIRETLRWAGYKRNMEATIAQNLNDGPGPASKAITATTPVERIFAVRNHSKSRDNDDTMLVSQTELTWKLSTGAVKHTVLGGLELGQEKLHRWNYNFCKPGTYNFAKNACGAQIAAAPFLPGVLAPLTSPNPSDAYPAFDKVPNFTTDTFANTTALYVQDQVEFTPAWKAVAGLRWENYKTGYDNFRSLTGLPAAVTAPTATNPGTPASLRKSDSMTSGRAGLIWQPTKAQSYYVSWGNSYNPAGELGVYGGTGLNLTNATINTEPEENVNSELGAQWDFSNGIRVRSALFRNEKKNARVTDPVTGGLAVLSGKQRIDGLEMEVAGSVTRDWDVTYSAAYMDGDIINGGTVTAIGGTTLAGKEVPVPHFGSSLWSVYRLGGGWEAGGGYVQSSTRWLNTGNTGQIPGYTIVNAMLGYVQKKYDVRLNIYNLFDKTYYVGGYENNPSFIVPGSPRAATVTVRYRFE